MQADVEGSLDAMVAVDLEGRVIGADQHAGVNGLRYQVDCRRKMQINARTGYERPCLRVETEIEQGGLVAKLQNLGAKPSDEVKEDIGLVDINSFTNKDGPGTAVTFNADKMDAREIDEDKMPPFPIDLIEAEAPLLLLQKGQLIQIQTKRDDGWMFGFVVWESLEVEDDKKDDRPRRAFAKKAQKVAPLLAGAGEAGEAGEADLTFELSEERAGDRGDDEDDLGGESSGWFPEIFVRPPQMTELKAMQDAMGGAEAAVDALAPPDTWSDDAKQGKSFDAKLIALRKGGDEYELVKNDFTKRLGDRKGSIKEITNISRLENLSLWQSYAAKKASMMCRAKAEGLDSSQYEKPMMYHGTSPDVIPKISQQGFNRGFAGRNAVRYGKVCLA